MASAAVTQLKAFVESHENWEGEDSYICQTGEYGAEDRVMLYSYTLKEVLDELYAAQAKLAQIHEMSAES